MVLAASFAIAQTSVINQTTTGSGASNSAIVTQTGDNESTINQTTWGTGHQAIVTQVQDIEGTKNISDVLQDQRGAEVNINQEGAANVAKLKQSGPNTADIDQIGTGNVLGSYANYTGMAFQKNGTSFSDDNNQLWVTQTGDRNKAGVSQEHHGSANIDQFGSDNQARVKQTGIAGDVINTVEVLENGDFNNAGISQTGEGNTGILWLNDANVGKATNNILNVTQSGDANRLDYKIRRGDIGGSYNTLDVTQTGNGHLNRIAVDGNHNGVTIVSNGNVGGSIYSGNKGDWSIQTGASLGGPWNTTSNGNSLDINAQGSNNTATGKIAGNRNDVVIAQNGSGNFVGTAWTMQDGVVIQSSDNDVTLVQNGDANKVTVLQKTGDFNVVNLTQDGGADADIVQNGNHNTLMGLDIDPIATSFNGSVLDLDQIGSGNTLHLQQTNGASATVMQDGMTNTSVVIQN
jgi:hypothetical protein